MLYRIFIVIMNSFLLIFLFTFSYFHFRRKTLSVPFTKRILTQAFIIITISLLLLFETLILTTIRPEKSPPSPSPTTPKIIVELKPSQIAINIDSPLLMQINRSYVVKVTLTAKSVKYISTLMLEKSQVTSADVTPVGTPGNTLEKAFGSNYGKPIAHATLSPSTGPFQITPIPPSEQSLDQQQVLWKWTVIPLEPGSQIVDVDIEATWLSSKGAKEGRIGDQQIRINVLPPPSTPTPSSTSTPFINVGQINIGEIITSVVVALFGAGGLGALLIIWLINRHKKKKSVNP